MSTILVGCWPRSLVSAAMIIRRKRYLLGLMALLEWFSCILLRKELGHGCDGNYPTYAAPQCTAGSRDCHMPPYTVTLT
ncbi:unnamed protein product [Protopolystoma xenopodis]|uniref:Uncharacterized protein n=1 Tax=Protopolystoma xenopodis TaxID=117903 RepID=A0A3S4ZS17_9PLAT|nr:unnamed protein product [Protopolystoma xenopodis]